MKGTPLFESRPSDVDPVEFLESVIFEDGLDAAMELAAHPHLVPNANPVTVPLILCKLLAAHAYSRLGTDHPFATDEPDALFGYFDDLACGAGVGVADDLDEDVRVLAHLSRFEAVTREAHRAAQSMEAVRARSIAEFSRWEHPDGPQGVSKQAWVRHPEGFTSLYSADTVAAELGLGIQAGIGMVERSARMVHRTPNLLAEVAGGRANLDTVADIATELQDASPDVCETVEEALLRRGMHRAARGQARKSCRTLVVKHQPSAARETAKKTKAQQCGVFQDPHPTPGLSLLSIIGDAGKLTAVKDAIDTLAFEMKRGDESGKTMGEYRVDAFFDLAMRGVSLHLDIQVLTPTFGTGGKTWDKPTTHGGPGDGGSAGGTPSGDPGPDPAPSDGGAPAEPPDIEPDVPPAFGGRKVDGRGFVASMCERGAVSVHARAGVIPADSLGGLAKFAKKVSVSMFEFEPGTGEPTANMIASESYRPSPTMARYVRTRDQRCRAPGCDRPAINEVDLDHAVPWPQGPTAAHNLECLCRRHHRMKQTQWRVVLRSNGTVEWTSPTGRQYLTTPGLAETWRDLADP